ncbi:hypothetical protein CYMTET_30157 [Cymbomonas tetramitiformis]|uniref:Uncharacterized protein n=1 Tax=Cymbomonas tetramitiformis TaxID=36881 RepID=A0AAE0FJM0_9CHLO|nr:hypothetical protein CYMTET_30157 [Cymbomonas tetramitiformis]
MGKKLKSVRVKPEPVKEVEHPFEPLACPVGWQDRAEPEEDTLSTANVSKGATWMTPEEMPEFMHKTGQTVLVVRAKAPSITFRKVSKITSRVSRTVKLGYFRCSTNLEQGFGSTVQVLRTRTHEGAKAVYFIFESAQYCQGQDDPHFLDQNKMDCRRKFNELSWMHYRRVTVMHREALCQLQRRLVEQSEVSSAVQSQVANQVQHETLMQENRKLKEKVDTISNSLKRAREDQKTLESGLARAERRVEKRNDDFAREHQEKIDMENKLIGVESELRMTQHDLWRANMEIQSQRDHYALLEARYKDLSTRNDSLTQ